MKKLKKVYHGIPYILFMQMNDLDTDIREEIREKLSDKLYFPMTRIAYKIFKGNYDEN